METNNIVPTKTYELNVNDIHTIENYGKDIISKIRITDDRLALAKKTSNVEINGLLTNILDEINKIDFSSFQKQSFINRLFKKLHIKKFIQKYNTISDTINNVVDKLEESTKVSEQDNAMIKNIYENNKEIIPEIDYLIEDGKKQLEKIKQTDLSSFEEFDVQTYNSFVYLLNKKINNLINVRNILTQELVQLKIMETNNYDLNNKIAEINTYVIPLWKHNMSTILMLENQSNSADLVKAISDTTNKMIEIEANLVYSNSVAIAKENERGIVDLETMKKSVDMLYKTINDVNTIHQNCANNQEIYEKELEELKEKIQVLFNKSIQ